MSAKNVMNKKVDIFIPCSNKDFPVMERAIPRIV